MSKCSGSRSLPVGYVSETVVVSESEGDRCEAMRAMQVGAGVWDAWCADKKWMLFRQFVWVGWMHV